MIKSFDFNPDYLRSNLQDRGFHRLLYSDARCRTSVTTPLEPKEDDPFVVDTHVLHSASMRTKVWADIVERAGDSEVEVVGVQVVEDEEPRHYLIPGQPPDVVGFEQVEQPVEPVAVHAHQQPDQLLGLARHHGISGSQFSKESLDSDSYLTCLVDGLAPWLGQ